MNSDLFAADRFGRFRGLIPMVMIRRRAGLAAMIIGLSAATSPLFSLDAPAEAVGFAGGGLHLFPLGWSSEGRWGALIGRSAGEGAGRIQLAVIDAVTDERLFESEYYLWSASAGMDEFWKANGRAITEIIESFDLESGRRTDVRTAEFNTGGITYTFLMKPPSPARGGYKLEINSARGDFKTVYETPAGAAPAESVLLGALLSPFERRALAVIREEPAQYRFIGAHLTVGFSYRRPNRQTAAQVPSGNLLSAVFNGQEYLVRARLAAGADPNLRDDRGYPVLLIAARLGHWTIVGDLLAAGAEPNARDSNGRSALHHAAFAGSSDAVRALIRAGADTSIKDAAGRTAEELAADEEVKSGFP